VVVAQKRVDACRFFFFFFFFFCFCFFFVFFFFSFFFVFFTRILVDLVFFGNLFPRLSLLQVAIVLADRPSFFPIDSDDDLFFASAFSRFRRLLSCCEQLAAYLQSAPILSIFSVRV